MIAASLVSIGAVASSLAVVNSKTNTAAIQLDSADIIGFLQQRIQELNSAIQKNQSLVTQLQEDIEKLQSQKKNYEKAVRDLTSYSRRPKSDRSKTEV